MRDEQKKRLLAGLLVLLALAAVWRFAPAIFTGSGEGVRQFSSGLAELSGTDRIATLDLALLNRAGRDYSAGRDPFSFYDPPPEPPPPRVETPQPVRPTPTPVPVDTGPRPPAITYEFLGSFGPEERKIAVLADGDEIFNAQVGEVLEDQFVIDAIGLESVDIKYIEFPDLPPKRLAAGADTTFGR
ncbi:MAG: hypothetical protein AAF481_18335 [Acidobacteriota bacterium]